LGHTSCFSLNWENRIKKIKNKVKGKKFVRILVVFAYYSSSRLSRIFYVLFHIQLQKKKRRTNKNGIFFMFYFRSWTRRVVIFLVLIIALNVDIRRPDGQRFIKQFRSIGRILVSITAHWSHNRPLQLNYFYRLLHEYEESYTSAGYTVHICVDTNSDELSKILSSKPVGKSTLVVRVFSLEELGSDPEYLPHMHRHYWEERKEDFDFFIFTEDDILFTRDSFEVYVERRQEVQEKGWIFGGVLVETWGIDNKTEVAIGIMESRPIKIVYETGSGHLWAEPWIPYTAHYVLDQDQLYKMIEDSSNVWVTGFPAIDTRANIALGYNYKYSGNQSSNPKGARGWQSRALVPITRDCKVQQPGGIVYHLPSKYAKSTTLVVNNDCIDGGPERDKFGPGSNFNCKLGTIPLSRVFLCHELQPIPLPVWPEGARLN